LPRRFGSQYVRISGIRVFDFFQEQWSWDSWNRWYPVGVDTHPTAGVYIYTHLPALVRWCPPLLAHERTGG
jgi:hypothetical protein